MRILSSAILDERLLRRKVNMIMNIIQSNKLFIHHELLRVRVERRIVNLPLILTMAILNALVPKGTMLLYGGHGGGKTTLAKILGRMMTGTPLKKIERSILRAHPHLTEEKAIARFDVARLMSGEEVVQWSEFVKTFWKIIDEVNRLSPHMQDVLFSLLAEGIVKYGSEVYEVRDYVLYATLNPKDVGTFPMGAPFMDRFSIAIQVTMPKAPHLFDILGRRDEKLYGFDEDTQVPAIMTEEEIINIWHIIDDTITVPEESMFFITYLIGSFRACIKTNKENAEFLNVDSGLCDNCHFNTRESVCNKIKTPPSVRAAKDLERYSKALAWLLGYDKVLPNFIVAVAPFVLWHRLDYPENILREKPYYGNKILLTKDLVQRIFNRYTRRGRRILEIIDKGWALKLTKSDLDELNQEAKADVFVASDVQPIIKSISEDSRYATYYKQVEKILNMIKVGRFDEKTIISKIDDLLSKIESDVTVTGKHKLVRELYNAIFSLTKRTIKMRLGEWREIQIDLIKQIPLKSLKRFFKDIIGGPLYRKFYGMPEIEIRVTIPSDDDNAMMTMDIAGGKLAIKVFETIERLRRNIR